MHLPDTNAPDPEPLEDDEGYHTDDDLSELEGDELQESLKKQEEGESEAVKESRNVFHVLLRDLTSKDWKKPHSNCNLGYGNKSSDRTRWNYAQHARGKEVGDAETI